MTVILKVVVLLTVTKITASSENPDHPRRIYKNAYKDNRQVLNTAHSQQTYEYYHPYSSNYGYHYELPKTGFEYHHEYVQRHGYPRQTFGYHHNFNKPPQHFSGPLIGPHNYGSSNHGNYYIDKFVGPSYREGQYRIMNNYPHNQHSHNNGNGHSHRYPYLEPGRFYYKRYNRPIRNYGGYGHAPYNKVHAGQNKWKGYGGYSSHFNGVGYDYGYDSEAEDYYRKMQYRH